jgi:hypothetical protein
MKLSVEEIHYDTLRGIARLLALLKCIHAYMDNSSELF